MPIEAKSEIAKTKAALYKKVFNNQTVVENLSNMGMICLTKQCGMAHDHSNETKFYVPDEI